MGRLEKRQPRVTRSEILRRHQPREHPSSTSEGAVSVEVGPLGDQPGESGLDRDYRLTFESTSTREGRQQYTGMPKMVPPILKDRGGFPDFREQVMVYAKHYRRFDRVFTSDPNVDVDSNDRHVAPRGIRGNV